MTTITHIPVSTTEIIQQAEAGDAEAQATLGLAYRAGSEMDKSPELAFHWLRLAAEQGDPRHVALLGFLCLAGDGVPQSYEEADLWLRQAAQQHALLAWCYVENLCPDRRNRGFDPIFNLIGMMYKDEVGFPAHLNEIVLWFTRVALWDDSRIFRSFAQNNLGLIYQTGTGVEKNLAEAYAWQRYARWGFFYELQITLKLNIIETISLEQGQAGERRLQELVREAKQALLAKNKLQPMNACWISSRLLVGAHPNDQDLSAGRTRIPDLLATGVCCFIDLTEEGERPSYAELLPARAKCQGTPGIDYHHFPFPKINPTIAPSMLMTILDIIDRANANGHVVYLHGNDDIARANLVAAAHLARRHLLPGAVELTRLISFWSQAKATPCLNRRELQRRLWRTGETPAIGQKLYFPSIKIDHQSFLNRNQETIFDNLNPDPACISVWWLMNAKEGTAVGQMKCTNSSYYGGGGGTGWASERKCCFTLGELTIVWFRLNTSYGRQHLIIAVLQDPDHVIPIYDTHWCSRNLLNAFQNPVDSKILCCWSMNLIGWRDSDLQKKRFAWIFELPAAKVLETLLRVNKRPDLAAIVTQGLEQAKTT